MGCKYAPAFNCVCFLVFNWVMRRYVNSIEISSFLETFQARKFLDQGQFLLCCPKCIASMTGSLKQTMVYKRVTNDRWSWICIVVSCTKHHRNIHIIDNLSSIPHPVCDVLTCKEDVKCFDPNLLTAMECVNVTCQVVLKFLGRTLN